MIDLLSPSTDRVPLRAHLPLLAVALLLPACENVVVSTVEVATVEVSPSRVVVVQGGRDTISVILKESGGSVLPGRRVTWSVDDAGVASVSDAGVVEGIAPGTTLVHASSEGIRGSTEVRVVSGPLIGLSSETVLLEGSAGDPGLIFAEIDVANAGTGTLDKLSVRVSEGSSSWLHVELLASRAPTRLRLRGNARDLQEGSEGALVFVESPSAGNSPVQVSVQFNVSGTALTASCTFQNHTFTNDLEIAENERCTFSNVRVRGDLTLRRGVRLTASGLTVEGDLDARDAEELVLEGAYIDGNLKFERGGSADIQDSEIEGNLDFKSNDGRLDLRDTLVDGNVKVEKNSGGPFSLLRNRIEGNLECKNNTPPPSGSGNVVDGSRKDQCKDM